MSHDCELCKKYMDKDGHLIPNEETLKAIQELENGEGKTFNTIEELFEDLNKD